MQQKSVKIEVRCNSNGFLVLKGKYLWGGWLLHYIEVSHVENTILVLPVPVMKLWDVCVFDV